MEGVVTPPATAVPATGRRLEPAFPWWLLLLAAIAVGLLFVNVSDDYWPGWARSIWNFGHVPLFAALAWLGWRWLPGRWAPLRWSIGLLITLLVGIAVELLQLTVGGREVSLDDVLLDLAGAWVGLWWVNHRRAWRWNRAVAVTLLMSTLLVVALAILPVLRAGGSALAAHYRFPVLLAGDMPLLSERMESTGGSSLSVSAAGLEVLLGAGPFAGFKVYDGPTDWRGFEELVIRLAHSAAAELVLTCRVHDIPHNLAFNDRFNRSFTLAPGAHELVIPLAEAAAAPASRQMALDEMLEVGCFADRDAAGERLHVREIRLR